MMRAKRALLVGMAGALVAGVTIVGLGGTSAASGKAMFRQPVGLNHFLCYGATTDPAVGPGFTVPPGVTVVNPLTPAGGFGPFLPGAAVTFDRHCNPAVKTLVVAKTKKVKATFPILNTGWHLSCFTVTNPVPPVVPTATVKNQFGQAALALQPPSDLCAPTQKSLQSATSLEPTGGIQPDHLTCYPVTYATATTKPFKVPAADLVTVQDEFATGPQTVQVLAPETLCVPTEKILPTGKVYAVANPKANLLCFGVTPTQVISPVWDSNQFGVSPVVIPSPPNDERLCLPSTVKLPKVK